MAVYLPGEGPPGEVKDAPWPTNRIRPAKPSRPQTPFCLRIRSCAIRATGERFSQEQWLAAHAAAEQRPRDECVDALMNAIARGDLMVEAPQTGG